ncbi:hypothetical protein ASPFODRAFT_281452 [Aspergillus luchuensis CBS 106.47]|uniref:Uncharacterized protein n=1 Tax=Aspergillus luchuensis (strain CBS 106.47) TaxID=1137211 RepID=A0A1M3U1T4_ASPLC|nr:hypothetical protein ASPFODRAFT_281452 [Aspergillus luchuensis CBS 106.47]
MLKSGLAGSASVALCPQMSFCIHESGECCAMPVRKKIIFAPRSNSTYDIYSYPSDYPTFQQLSSLAGGPNALAQFFFFFFFFFLRGPLALIDSIQTVQPGWWSDQGY